MRRWILAGASVTVPAVRTEVVDTVGAGDSFMAAMLAWCAEHRMLGSDAATELSHAGMQQLLEYAACAAAITCARAGANPPTRAELDAELAALAR